MALLSACEQFADLEAFKASGCDCSDTPDEVIEEALDLATDTLVYKVQGRYRGQCEQVLLPCREACAWDLRCLCGCGRRGGIEIPGENVAVTQVAIDGDVLDESAYEFVQGFPHNKLYRIDGQSWPASPNIGNNSSLAITVSYGFPINQWARDAALELACWLVKKGNGKSPATLDPRTTATTVDGVSMQLSEERDGFPAMLKFVDIYAPQTSAVWAPELAPAWRV